MSLTDETLTPYVISFAANNSCERQLKVFERSVSNAPKTNLYWNRIGILKVSYQKIQNVGYTTIVQKPFTSFKGV